ncbi:MAG TPA: hypothetical protein VN316_00995 [candidate division Zixibacteria bacterium]|nr:hypothetical protein [candidate division Zixibacteria bacterium]
MSNELKGIYRLGGISFIISGILFLVKYLLDLMAGPPPSNGAEILTWMATGKLPLEIANEVLFFAVMFLVPAVIALYYSLASIDRTKAAVGCGIIAVVIPIILVLDIVQGRLIYPVYNISVNTPAVAELVVAIYYGGLHAISELLGFATIVLSLAMKHGVYGRNIAYLGIATGVFDIIGSYPWIIGPILVLVSQILFAAWFLAVGWKLYRMR